MTRLSLVLVCTALLCLLAESTLHETSFFRKTNRTMASFLRGTNLTTRVLKVENLSLDNDAMSVPCSREKPCMTVPGCSATVFNTATGSCEYKNLSRVLLIGTFLSGAKFASGFRTEFTISAPARICATPVTMKGVALGPDDLAMLPSYDYTMCYFKCRLNKTCHFATFIPTKSAGNGNGTCHLKSAWTGLEPAEHATTVVMARTTDNGCWA